MRDFLKKLLEKVILVTLKKLLEKVILVTSEQAETADFRVCSNQYFPGTIEGRCSFCGGKIWADLSGPVRPLKVCVKCVCDGKYKKFMGLNR